jgi:eukaryotic-like serine/threonine-protein kinase
LLRGSISRMGEKKPDDGSIITGLAPAEVARTLRASRIEGPTSSAMRPILDSTHDRYRRIRELGRGGMGRVDEVFDQKLGRPVAQKKVLYEAGEDPAILLVAEAQTCAQLEHPSIVPVYDVSTDEDGNPAYTMRIVRGETLRKVMNDENRSLARLLGILRQVCLAVDYAHSRGVVHRDLKPENIIVGEFGEVYVLDWGVAHIIEGSDIRREFFQAFVAGTPGYMPPEQSNGVIDGRTDVYALGVILYEILTGERPGNDASPPSRRGAPNAFDALVMRCIAAEPSLRPANPRSVADAIDQFLDVEREREQRARDADQLVDDGATALAEAMTLEEEAREQQASAEEALLGLPAWESADRKQALWLEQQQASARLAEAAVLLARAEAAFIGALARVVDHGRARRGLAALYLQQFLAADAQGDVERRARYLHLARRYDDGTFTLELADEGELHVECGGEFTITPYRRDGLRMVPGEPVSPGRLPARSYLITSGELRMPVLVERAKRHRVRVVTREVPPGMVLVPGGPFLAPVARGGLRFERAVLDDFAIGQYPVTLREFAPFLESLSDEERARRCPAHIRRVRAHEYRLADDWLSAEAAPRVADPLDMPMLDITWFTALRYLQWLGTITGMPYRLPTSLEWDKAARGADGRVFPMGNSLDPSFAKVRESRPEFAQPEAIGAFPLDESPYLVRDLAGGVGDWTSTMEDGKPAPTLADEDDEVQRHRAVVWRGGYWSLALLHRSALRFTSYAKAQAAWVGFRVALSLPGESSSVATESLLHDEIGLPESDVR